MRNNIIGLIVLAGVMVLAIFAFGCADGQKACTEEAKVCPDGSSVGRTGPNCEFAPCPGENTQIANPASTFCIEQGGSLEIVDNDGGQIGMCTLGDGTVCEEWAFFRGECGPNIPVVCTDEQKNNQMCTREYMPVCGTDGKTYGNKCTACAAGVNAYIVGECPINTDGCGEGCPMLSPAGPDFCKEGTLASGGKDDCGCERPPVCMDDSGLTLCTEEQKSAQICTMEYMPVCGKSVLNTGEVVYQTYGNKCGACAEMKVVGYLDGECPERN